jgi:hypothetical protein
VSALFFSVLFRHGRERLKRKQQRKYNTKPDMIKLLSINLAALTFFSKSGNKFNRYFLFNNKRIELVHGFAAINLI